MKQLVKYIALCCVACLMWACSNDSSEVVPVQQTAIQIATEMSALATRATTPVTTEFTNFRLYGVKKVDGELQDVFDDYGFVQQTGEGGVVTGWEYASHKQAIYPDQSRQYWDYSAKEYRYVAGAPYEKVTFNPLFGEMQLADLDQGFEVFPGSVSTLPADPFTAPFFAMPAQVLPAAYGTPVPMKFRYALCKVKIVFRYRNVRGTNMLLKDITFTPKIGGYYATHGNLLVTYEFEHTPAYSIELKDYSTYLTTNTLHFSNIIMQAPCTTQQIAPEGYWMLPSTNGYHSQWDVQVTTMPIMTIIPEAGEKTFSAPVPADDMYWQPGYSYTYVFELTDDGLEYISRVQVGIKNWDLLTPIEHDFYNW